MPDPSNPNLELRRWGATSLFIVPGTEKAVFEERRVPHGAVHVEFYDSPNLDTNRMVYVYTPPGYEKSKQKYPVLYLLHGNGQIEASWVWTGRANVIMDNLLRRRKDQADGSRDAATVTCSRESRLLPALALRRMIRLQLKENFSPR